MTGEPYILHHYWISPFSEKVRLVFGMKGLTWNSVIIPEVMPKPDFTPLTGGYRRTPALQIGADVYCDTRLIVDVLERRHPENSVYADYPKGLVHAVVSWAEDQFFWPIARYITGLNAEHVGSRLHDDRAAMRGNPPPPLDRVKAAAPRNLPEMHIQLAWLESALGGQRPFLLGERLSLADIAAYHGVWFLGVFPISGMDQIERYPAIRRWMDRVEILGHGSISSMESAEALQVAASAAPASPGVSDVASPTGLLGRKVGVRPTDYGPDTVIGELVYEGANQVTLLRDAGAPLGEICVHFPRLQYIVKPIG